MKINKLFLKFISAGLALAISSTAYAVDINTARGSVSFPQSLSARVAVYDMAAMDTLESLGVKPQGVVAPLLVDYLNQNQAEDAVKIGTLFEPDMEALNRLKPEAIIIGGRMAPKHDELTRIAPVVDVTNTGVSVETSLKLLQELGKLFAKEERSAQLQKS